MFVFMDCPKDHIIKHNENPIVLPNVSIFITKHDALKEFRQSGGLTIVGLIGTEPLFLDILLISWSTK